MFAAWALIFAGLCLLFLALSVLNDHNDPPDIWGD